MKQLTILLAAVLLVSCFPEYEPPENYKGGIIVDKGVESLITIKAWNKEWKCYHYIETRFYPGDFRNYKLGDTIK